MGIKCKIIILLIVFLNFLNSVFAVSDCGCGNDACSKKVWWWCERDPNYCAGTNVYYCCCGSCCSYSVDSIPLSCEAMGCAIRGMPSCYLYDFCPSCTNECTAGNKRCSGNTVQRCQDCDGDPCVEWCDVETCSGYNYQCSDTGDIAKCNNVCIQVVDNAWCDYSDCSLYADCEDKATDTDSGDDPTNYGICQDEELCTADCEVWEECDSCPLTYRYDYCSSSTHLVEYYPSGGDCVSKDYYCSDFEVKASDSYGDDPSHTETCYGGVGAECSNGEFVTYDRSDYTDHCTGTCHPSSGSNGCYFVEYYPADSSDACSGKDYCASKSYDADTNSNTCNTCSLAWGLGCSSGDNCASSPSTCCGDDANEWASSCSCNSNACSCSGDTKACCATSNSCVWNGGCYSNGYSSDIDSDSITEKCIAGTWYAYPVIQSISVNYNEIDRDKETSGTIDTVRISVSVYDQDNYDREDVYITIKAPSGTKVVDTQAMTCSYSGANTWNCYYDYNPNDDAELGYYDVIIEAEDKEGLTDSETKYDLFKVNDISMSFSVTIKKTNYIRIEGNVKKAYENSYVSGANVHCSLNGNIFPSQFDHGGSSRTYKETTTDVNGNFIIEFRALEEPLLSTKRKIFCMAQSSSSPYLDGGTGKLPNIKAEVTNADITTPCYYWLYKISSYDEEAWENASFALGPKDGRYAEGNSSIAFEFEGVLPSGWIEFYVNGKAAVYVGELFPSTFLGYIDNTSTLTFSSNVKYIQLVPMPRIEIDAIEAHSITHDLRINQIAKINVTVKTKPEYDLKHGIIGANFSGNLAKLTLDTSEFQLDVSDEKTFSLEKEASAFGYGYLNITSHIRDDNVDTDNDTSYGEFYQDALDICFQGETCYNSWYLIIDTPPYGINLTWFGNKDGNKIVDRNKEAPQTADIMFFNITAKDLDAIYNDSERLYITLRFRSDQANIYEGNSVTDCVDKEMQLIDKTSGTYFVTCQFNPPNSMPDIDLGYFDLEIKVRDKWGKETTLDFDANKDIFKVEDIKVENLVILNNTTFSLAKGKARLLSNNKPLSSITAQNCSYTLPLKLYEEGADVELCGIKPFVPTDCKLSGYNFSCFILDLKLLRKNTSVRYVITNEYNISGYFDYNVVLHGTINSLNITDKDKWVNPMDNIWYIINLTNNGNLGWHGKVWNQTRIKVYSLPSQNPANILHISLNYSYNSSWINLPNGSTSEFSYFLGNTYYILGLYNYTAELHYFWPYFNGSFYGQLPRQVDFEITNGSYTLFRVAAIDIVDWQVPGIVTRTEPLEIKIKGYLVGDMEFDKWEKIQAFEFLTSDNNSYAKYMVTKYNLNTGEEDEEIPWENMSFNGLTNYWEALIDTSSLSCDNDTTIHRVYMMINFTKYGIFKPYIKHEWEPQYNPYFYQEVVIDCGRVSKDLYIIKPDQARVPLGTKNKRLFMIVIQNPGDIDRKVKITLQVKGLAENWIWLGDIGKKEKEIILVIPKMQGENYGHNSTYIWIENAGRAGYYPIEITISDPDTGEILFEKKSYINITMYVMDELNLYTLLILILTLISSAILTKKKLF